MTMAKPHKSQTSLLERLLRKDFRTPGLLVLAALIAADFIVPHHGYFGIDGTLGFSVWFSALACFTLITLALAVGSLLRKPEATYDD
jgi:hypothetical protein